MISDDKVAPRTGAWIETTLQAKQYSSVVSLPARERGLKQPEYVSYWHIGKSLPARERGLKLFTLDGSSGWQWSLPARERGLKPMWRKYLCPFLSRSPHGSVD